MENTQQKPRDYSNAAIIGLTIGIFLIPTIRNLIGAKPLYYIAAIIAFPILSVLGIWIAKSLFGRRFPGIYQFMKFGLIGVSNTAVNFGVVNTLVYITNITSGAKLIPITVLAFLLSLTNSYFWNSHWSFNTEGTRTLSQFLKFGMVTLVGVILNSGVVYAITKITPPGGISPKLWVNIANLIAVLGVMFWNFFGFKLVVFKQKVPQQQ